MRKWVTVMLALGLALAGCAEQEESSDEVHDIGADDDGNRTVSGNATSNAAPLATLDADAGNGTVPLNVTFTLDGSDDDGDNLTWTLSVGTLADGTDEEGNSTEPDGGARNLTQIADGASLPATVSHNFTDAGNFSVVLAVSDGVNTTETTLVVSVIAAADDVPDPVVITGSALIPNPVLGSTLLCFQDGIDGDIYDIAPAAPGWEYTLEDGDLWALYWWSGGSYMSTGDDSGVVPDDADQAEICSDAAVGNLDEFTLTLTHPDWEG